MNMYNRNVRFNLRNAKASSHWLIWFVNEGALYNHALCGVGVVCAIIRTNTVNKLNAKRFNFRNGKRVAQNFTPGSVRHKPVIMAVFTVFCCIFFQSRRISGTGKSKAKWEKYENKRYECIVFLRRDFFIYWITFHSQEFQNAAIRKKTFFP